MHTALPVNKMLKLKLKRQFTKNHRSTCTVQYYTCFSTSTSWKGS